MIALAGSLDSNILLRMLLNDIPDQHLAVLQLLANPKTAFDVADTAIIEIAFVLSYAYFFTRSNISEAINGIMRLNQIKCNRELFKKALVIFLDHPKLSFEDCCLAVYAELNDARPLWTFDKKLASQAPNTKLLS